MGSAVGPSRIKKSGCSSESRLPIFTIDFLKGIIYSWDMTAKEYELRTKSGQPIYHNIRGFTLKRVREKPFRNFATNPKSDATWREKMLAKAQEKLELPLEWVEIGESQFIWA